LAFAALVGLGAVRAQGEPAVRVLLVPSAKSVRIHDGAGGGPGNVTAGAAGLRIAGRAGRNVGARLRLPGPGPWSVGGTRVRGALDVVRTEEGLRVVNEVPLEAYVAGSLALEVPARFGPEVMRAQAVAIRSYALHERARRAAEPWDVTTTTASLRYGGIDAETDLARSAARETAGEYLAHDGEPILAAFHSAAGGSTASAGEVWREGRDYLQPVAIDGEDLSPDTYWRRRVSRAELARAAASLGAEVGDVRAVAVSERSPSGRARRVRLDGSEGSAELDAVRLRAALGETRVKSTLFEIRPDPSGDGFVFVGSGRGHGVGMSQWGAYALAREGADYHRILQHFYPGATPARVARGMP
jgi:stage II sporulation protein D